MLKDACQASAKFLREAFSESGTGSASRLLAGLVVVSTIGWVWYYVLVHKALPDLGGPSLFIGSGTSATYGLNQAKTIVASFKGGSNGTVTGSGS